MENSSQILNVFYDLAAKCFKPLALDEYSRWYENLHTSQWLIKSMGSFVAKGSTNGVAVVVASNHVPVVRRINQPLRRQCVKHVDGLVHRHEPGRTGKRKYIETIPSAHISPL